MNNYLGFYNGPLQASAGFSWASTGFYTGHFEPLRTSTDLNWPELASTDLNWPHLPSTGVIWAYVGPNGRFRIHRPLMELSWANSGLSWTTASRMGPLRASWVSAGQYGQYGPLMGLYGPLRGPKRPLMGFYGPLLA
jgi:hypothetical protein